MKLSDVIGGIIFVILLLIIGFIVFVYFILELVAYIAPYLILIALVTFIVLAIMQSKNPTEYEKVKKEWSIFINWLKK